MINKKKIIERLNYENLLNEYLIIEKSNSLDECGNKAFTQGFIAGIKRAIKTNENIIKYLGGNLDE